MSFFFLLVFITLIIFSPYFSFLKEFSLFKICFHSSSFHISLFPFKIFHYFKNFFPLFFPFKADFHFKILTIFPLPNYLIFPFFKLIFTALTYSFHSFPFSKLPDIIFIFKSFIITHFLIAFLFFFFWQNILNTYVGRGEDKERGGGKPNKTRNC